MAPTWLTHASRLTSFLLPTGAPKRQRSKPPLVVINLVSTQPAPAAAPVDDKVRILGRGVKSLRRKFGLTQEELGKLTGVSLGGVRAWERQKGMLKLKDASKAAIMAIKGIGKAEARKRLDAMKPVKKIVAKVRKVSKSGKARRRRK